MVQMAEGFQADKEFDPFEDYLGLSEVVKDIVKSYSEKPHTNKESPVECYWQGIQNGSYFGGSELSTDRRNTKRGAYSEVIQRKTVGAKSYMDSREGLITTSTTAISTNPPRYSLASRKGSAAHASQKLKVCM